MRKSEISDFVIILIFRKFIISICRNWMSAGHAPRKKVAELKVLTKSSTNPGRVSNFEYSQRTVSSKMQENLIIEICDSFFRFTM